MTGQFVHEDCSPESPQSVIRSAQANTSVSTEALLTELFDNSIDAGARRIEATIRGSSLGSGRGSFSIVDDGEGVPRIGVLMRQSESTKVHNDDLDEGPIGRFGVGAKDCIHTVGGLASTLDVESRTRSNCWRTTIVWASQRSWQHPMEIVEPGDLSLATRPGVRLTMRKCHRAMPSAAKMMTHLSRVHWPWLEKQGNTMLVNGARVEPPAVPRTDGRLDDGVEVRVGPDRWFSVSGGVLQEPSDLNGVTVFCGNRSIYVAQAIGLGSFSKGGIFALVRLHGKWDLDRNKLGLQEVDAENLRAALEDILQPMLEEASERMRTLADDDMLDRLNTAFGSVQATGKPKRPGKTEEKKRERKPAGTDRKVREAEFVDGVGEARQRRIARDSRPYLIDFVDGDQELIGAVDADSRRINLYRNNTAVAEVKLRENDEALLFFAAALLADHKSRERGGLPFPGKFASLVATILARETAAVS